MSSAGNTLSLKEKEFVEASRAIGAGNLRIIGGDVLPNLPAPVIVLATLLDPPEHPLRGGALVPRPRRPARPGLVGANTRRCVGAVRRSVVAMVFPGAFLVATTLSFNLLGDGLRDALDVRSDR